MPSKNILFHQKVLLAIAVGWLLPIGMLVINFKLVLDPNQSIDAFEKVSFMPALIEVVDDIAISRKAKETDHFELWITAPDGGQYFIRDPELGPIQAIRQAIPEGEALEIHFAVSFEGNRIMNLAVQSSGDIAVSLEAILEGERRKRTVINLAALGMFLLGNALLWWNYRNLKIGAA